MAKAKKTAKPKPKTKTGKYKKKIIVGGSFDQLFDAAINVSPKEIKK